MNGDGALFCWKLAPLPPAQEKGGEEEEGLLVVMHESDG